MKYDSYLMLTILTIIIDNEKYYRQSSYYHIAKHGLQTDNLSRDRNNDRKANIFEEGWPSLDNHPDSAEH